MFCLRVWKGREMRGLKKKMNEQMEEADNIERGRL